MRLVWTCQLMTSTGRQKVGVWRTLKTHVQKPCRLTAYRPSLAMLFHAVSSTAYHAWRTQHPSTLPPSAHLVPPIKPTHQPTHQSSQNIKEIIKSEGHAHGLALKTEAVHSPAPPALLALPAADKDAWNVQLFRSIDSGKDGGAALCAGLRHALQLCRAVTARACLLCARCSQHPCIHARSPCTLAGARSAGGWRCRMAGPGALWPGQPPAHQHGLMHGQQVASLDQLFGFTPLPFLCATHGVAHDLSMLMCACADAAAGFPKKDGAYSAGLTAGKGKVRVACGCCLLWCQSA
jgi:hypothetical protein